MPYRNNTTSGLAQHGEANHQRQQLQRAAPVRTSAPTTSCRERCGAMLLHPHAVPGQHGDGEPEPQFSTSCPMPSNAEEMDSAAPATTSDSTTPARTPPSPSRGCRRGRARAREHDADERGLEDFTKGNDCGTDMTYFAISQPRAVA
jgi:hypothetical protein